MRIHAHEVAAYVANLHDIPMGSFYGKQQTRCMARPRQIAMYCIRLLSPHMSLIAIGRMMGRDHTTVLFGVRRIEALIETNTAVADAVQQVLSHFTGKAAPASRHTIPKGNAWLLLCHQYGQAMRLAA